MSKNLHLNGSSYKLTVGWEGKRSHSYLDSVRIPTIGTGFMRHTLGTHAGHRVCVDDTMTDEKIKVEFLNRTKSYRNGVKEVVKVPLIQSQFSACVPLCYNADVTAFTKSTVIRRLNEYKYKTVCDALAV